MSNLTEFTVKAVKIHGNKYNYDKTEYINAHTKILISCNTCKNLFLQTPNKHLLGHGCPNCAIINKRKPVLTTEEYISKAKSVHGDKYNYDNTIYSGPNKKVVIHCNNCGHDLEQIANIHLKSGKCANCAKINKVKEFVELALKLHGNKYNYNQVTEISKRKLKIYCNTCKKYFYQSKSRHLNSLGCRECAGNKQLTTDKFKKIAEKLHGNKYNYDLIEGPISHRKKIEIYCNRCNKTFIQKVSSHLEGSGCTACHLDSLRNSDFVERAKQVNGDKYGYDQVIYERRTAKVKILCNRCGQYFWQTPDSHLCGWVGCDNCRINKTITNKDFIERSKEIHGNKYNYDKIEYKNYRSKIKIYCNNCNQFFIQIAGNHLKGSGCPYCTDSNFQVEVYNFINDMEPAEYNNRKEIYPSELDIYIPNFKLAIELNGTYWHSDFYLHKNYHLEKSIKCENKGINLIQIFENEYNNKKEIVKSLLKSFINKNTTINALQCDVKELNNETLISFIRSNSIYNNIKATINLGLFYNDKAVAVMGINDSIIVNYTELIDNKIINGINRLVNYFVVKYIPDKIAVEDDRRISYFDIYKWMGFNREKIIEPREYLNYRGNKVWDAGYNLLTWMRLGPNWPIMDEEIRR